MRCIRLLALCLALLAGSVCPAMAAAAAAQNSPKAVHVLVPLCDNANQGIVPVPARIGNGQDPEGNLYWGAAYGMKTFMRKQKEWQLEAVVKNPGPAILERLVFRHANGTATLVADAYDGACMRETLRDFFDYAAGARGFSVERPVAPAAARSQHPSAKAGGNADLIIFAGHNGLMDLALGALPQKKPGAGRETAVFACMSKQYFTAPLQAVGGTPIALTTNFMCPEAYTISALIKSWLQGDTPAQRREAMAQAYNTYQKCGLPGARRLFTAQ